MVIKPRIHPVNPTKPPTNLKLWWLLQAIHGVNVALQSPRESYQTPTKFETAVGFAGNSALLKPSVQSRADINVGSQG